MEQPQGCEIADRDYYVGKLQKSIYGLPQSGRNWNEDLDDKLRKIGLKKSQHDNCIYYNKTLIVGIHVDDFIIIEEKKDIDLFKKQLKTFYAIKELGAVKNLLSINVNTTERHAIHSCQASKKFSETSTWRIAKDSQLSCHQITRVKMN
jgi:hypothetical protein